MFPHSQGNISFQQSRIEARKSRESCLHKGSFLYSCVLLWFRNTLVPSPEVQEHPGAHSGTLSGAPPSGEHPCTRTSPTTFLFLWGNSNLKQHQLTLDHQHKRQYGSKWGCRSKGIIGTKISWAAQVLNVKRAPTERVCPVAPGFPGLANCMWEKSKG
jgi:hypothetical protein